MPVSLNALALSTRRQGIENGQIWSQFGIDGTKLTQKLTSFSEKHVFLNGDGLCCRNASFTRLQLEVGGLPYAMELIAREYNARPKKFSQRAQQKSVAAGRRGIASSGEAWLYGSKQRVRILWLVRMDGSKVESIEELVTRGAYVLVQAGENFHECWYFLPDYAVDTSLSPERALVRRSSIKGSKETKSDAYALASASPGVSREQEVMP